MKIAAAFGCWLSFALVLAAQETPPPVVDKSPAEKADYSELSRMIRGAVLKSAPKEYVPPPEWGLSTPYPPRLILRGLPRTTIKVGDELQLAHGSWKRAKVWVENPEKEFTLDVTDLKPLESSRYRVALTSAAPLQIDYEFQQWLNGLMLLGVQGHATARIKVDLECEVALSLDVAKFPPEVSVDPKIVSTKIDVQELQVLNPANANRPDRAVGINNEIRNFVQGLVREGEPRVQDEANKAIAQAIRDGKGRFSAAKLFEATKK